MGKPDGALPAIFAKTARNRIKRAHEDARYERAEVYRILDAGFVCHIGYSIDGQPYTTPTAYWRQGDRVFWHGSSASRMIRALAGGAPLCFTVALFDGLVLARSGFHTSINYRSVMAFGTAERVEGRDAKLAALEAMMERVVPGRWPELRPASDQELKATTVLSLALTEAAAKVSAGPPNDDAADYALDIWAGVVPVHLAIGAARDDPKLKPGVAAPDYLRKIRLD
jgi:nitroimidazol reductase NimA-like FMN-containing flavoprotein (pyridoxamine 5'-phosphate oxidase superfamily)